MGYLGDGTTVTSSDDGIRISKVPEPDSVPVPSVRLAVTSTVRDPVEVTVVEVVPDGVTVDDLVLSSPYRPRELAVEDGRLRFDAVVRPGETVEVVYGLREDADGDICSLLSSPILERTARLETVESGDDGEAAGDDNRGGGAGGGDAGRGDAVGGDAGVGDSGGADDCDGDVADDVLEAAGQAAVPDPGTVAGAASAVMTRGGTAAGDDRTPAGAGGPGGGSTDGERGTGGVASGAGDEFERRLSALDRQFHDLEAFFEAAGGFLDDGELPRDVLSDLADQRYSIQRRYRALEADLARLEADVHQLVEAVSSELTALEERLGSATPTTDDDVSGTAGVDAADDPRDQRLDAARDD